MRVGELAERLGVPYRDVRYVLECGVVPEGVAEASGRGDHRHLTVAQACWLAMVLHLKRNGVRVPAAGVIARYAEYAVHGVARRLNWDHRYDSFRGSLETEFQWYLDCADCRYARLATTAKPSKGGRLEEFGWVDFGMMREAKAVAPVVFMRVDLGGLGRLVRDCRGRGPGRASSG
jgi:hypothetical protein